MNTTRHVVVGAGPLGRYLAAELIGRGFAVRLVTRSGSVTISGAEPFAADLSDPDAAAAACAGASVVYQCAAPPYHRWGELFPALQDHVMRGAAKADAVVVAAENLYGYGVAGDLHEGLPPGATTRKGAVRAAMSRRLFEAHAKGDVRAVAGRASDFFGPDVRVSALGGRFFPPLLAGKAVSWFGDPEVPHSFTYLPDFAKALITLAMDPAAYGRAWHVPSPPVLTPQALADRVAALAGVQARHLRRTPAWLLRGIGLFVPAAGEMVEMSYAFHQPFIMSHNAFTERFGIRATGWDEALGATIAWWRRGTGAT